MILVKAPLRLGLFGGGSDIPEYYNDDHGFCITAAIDKYIYLGVNRPQHDVFKIVYSIIEQTNSVDNIKHDIVRETLKQFNILDRFELSTFADIPIRGTGLGSSSTFAVALVAACYRMVGVTVSTSELAEMACIIEIAKCKQPIGKQDQYAAAFGGFNTFTFTKNGVEVWPFGSNDPSFDPQVLTKLENNLMLFYTGVNRNASDVLSKQFGHDKSKTYTKHLVELAYDAERVLKGGDVDLFGELLDVGWQLKKQINPYTSNPDIDNAYFMALNAGARGGKIVGAGGGGYLLLYCKDEHKKNVKQTMADIGYKRFDFKFEQKGCQIVYDSQFD